MNICIIPARGGSVGIPKKNLRLLCGEPLLGWTIKQALETIDIDSVYVSTDDTEIAEYAISKGALVIDRPSELSGDDACSESAIEHALISIKPNLNSNSDVIVFLQATSPLRKPDDISKAIRLFRDTEADSLFSTCVAADLTLWNKNDFGWQSINFDYKNRAIRQDTPIQYIENGSIYLFHPNILVKYGNRLGGSIESYVMEPWQVHEIDTEEDFVLIEYFMERYIIGKE